MIAEQPAVGIMKSMEFKDGSTGFSIECDCHDPDHMVSMWINVDLDNTVDIHDDITIEFHVNTTTPFWNEGFSRVKAAWDILVHGYREDSHTLILRPQAALNLSNAIATTVEKLTKKND